MFFWLARSAGRLIRSGLGLVPLVPSWVDPEVSEFQKSPADAPSPAKATFKGRSCSNLRLLYQDFSPYTSPYPCPDIFCPVNQRADENIETLDSETLQPDGRESGGTAAVFFHSSKWRCLLPLLEQDLLFFSRVRETISSFLTTEVQLFFPPSKPPALVFSDISIKKAMLRQTTTLCKTVITKCNRKNSTVSTAHMAQRLRSGCDQAPFVFKIFLKNSLYKPIESLHQNGK